MALIEPPLHFVKKPSATPPEPDLFGCDLHGFNVGHAIRFVQAVLPVSPDDLRAGGRLRQRLDLDMGDVLQRDIVERKRRAFKKVVEAADIDRVTTVQRPLVGPLGRAVHLIGGHLGAVSDDGFPGPGFCRQFDNDIMQVERLEAEVADKTACLQARADAHIDQDFGPLLPPQADEKDLQIDDPDHHHRGVEHNLQHVAVLRNPINHRAATAR